MANQIQNAPTPPGGPIDFQIGAQPMSANARAVLQQMMAKPSDDWGSALSRLGAAAALGHAERKGRDAKQKKKIATEENRQRWAESLGAGMTPRDLAVSDPDFLADTDFQKRWAGTAPAPEVEKWNTIQNPYDRGGDAQINSITGEIKGYQPPAATPERRIVTGADERQYYADTQEPVLPNVQAPPPETATADFKDVRSLAADWESATEPVRDLSRQRDLMQIGLEAARRGDMGAGSQAVLVTFQKILDPSSVVRESEYARSASGLGLLERVKGAAERLDKGGAGVTVTELQAFARLADEAVSRFGSGWLDQERERIGRFADAYNIPREFVFQSGGPAAQGAPQGMPPMAQGAPMGIGNAPDTAGQGLAAALAQTLTGGQPLAAGPPQAPRQSPLPTASPQSPQAAARMMLDLPDNEFMARASAISPEEMTTMPADVLQALSARMNQIGGR